MTLSMTNKTDRFFLANDSLVDRATYVSFLRRCAADWLKIADGSFYGIKRKDVDTEALSQAERVKLSAETIEAEGKRLGFL